MRYAVLLAVLISPAYSEATLFAAAAFTKEYVVGARLPASGVFSLGPDGRWFHAGYNLPVLSAISRDPNDPKSLLIAAGNGLIRTSRDGSRFRIVTAEDVTELRDVAVTDSSIYFAHSAGARLSRDGGLTWTELADGLRRKYIEAIRVTKNDALIAGTETGLFRYESGKWTLAGASGFPVLRIEVSPHDPCFVVAGTQGGGLYASRNCGQSFESGGALGVGKNLYGIAFDPSRPQRIAVGGFGDGVVVSNDGGKTWLLRNHGLPSHEVSAVAFDPDRPGRLYAAVHEQAVFVSDDAGATWRKAGLDGGHVYSLRFLPDGGR